MAGILYELICINGSTCRPNTASESLKDAARTAFSFINLYFWLKVSMADLKKRFVCGLALPQERCLFLFFLLQQAQHLQTAIP